MDGSAAVLLMSDCGITKMSSRDAIQKGETNQPLLFLRRSRSGSFYYSLLWGKLPVVYPQGRKDFLSGDHSKLEVSEPTLGFEWSRDSGVDKQQMSETPGAHWEHYYADFFVSRYLK